MEKNVMVWRIFDKDTVRDTLNKELDLIRAQGFSIFGVNEGAKISGTDGTRLVKIFYE